MIVFSPSDNYVLTADFGGAFRCFDRSTGKLMWYYHISENEMSVDQDPGTGFIPFMEIAFSPDEKFVVVGGRNRKTNTDCFLVFQEDHGLVSSYSLSSGGGFLPKTKFGPTSDYFYISNGKKLLKFALRRSK